MEPTVLDRYKVVQRIVILYLMGSHFLITYWSFDFARFGVLNSLSATDIVLIVGSLQSTMTILLGYCFKVYMEQIK
mgnify:CR=1 FL=1